MNLKKNIMKYTGILAIASLALTNCNQNNTNEFNTNYKNISVPNLTLNVIEKTDSSTVYRAKEISNVLVEKIKLTDSTQKMIFDIDKGKEGFVHTEYEFNNNKIINIEIFSRYYDNEKKKVYDNTRTTENINVKGFEHYLPINLAEMDTADFEYFEEKVHEKILKEMMGNTESKLKID